ncbi:cellulose biosynthesis protein BcsS [Tepidamorphus sp. 3E244]|uniref:cellulose biosynthesis protein BcsS n=1 Tax=Tepidamorphus sp. 3E244 TaxID=3385498 RepID=UPI0038FC05B6
MLKAVFATATLAPCALAQPSAAQDPRFEIFSGAELSVTSRFLYSGVIVAPFGGLDTPGLRLRAYGGAGDYKLDDGTWVAKQAGHALIGWAHWWGNHGLTLYAGISGEHHDAAPTQSKHGTELGASVLAEGWWRVAPDTILSASAGYTDVYENVSGRIGVTHALNERWGLIGEVRGGDDIDGAYWAAGAGVTAHYRGYDAALVAGLSGDEDDSGFSLRAQFSTRR